MDMEINDVETPETPEPHVTVPPVTNRFLYVDIAALRAKQLRRGALPRLDGPGESVSHRDTPHKPERVAMEEVRRGLVQYDLPPLRPIVGEQ
jgi:DNA-directed RNA polymerase subunit K/omega